MKRRDLFRITTAAAAVLPFAVALPAIGAAASAAALQAPASGPIKAAFVLSHGAVVIDFAGPWEVFDNVGMPGQPHANAFELYVVAATLDPILTSSGMIVVPNYTFATAPPPQVIVIPAQDDPGEAALAWIRQASAQADLTMSVCNGAFVLAKTGLLAGHSATAYHGAYNQFAMQFPEVILVRGVRFVESGKFASAGGLSSGIDLALRVVERYFSRAVAQRTAYALEYQGRGWQDPQSNRVYATRRRGTAQHPVCPVCDMDVDRATAPASTWRRQTFYFCMETHKQAFDAHPASYARRD